MDLRHQIASTLPYYGIETNLVEDQDSSDIIVFLKKNHKQNQKDYDNIAIDFWQGNAGDTAKYLFDFCKKNIAYKIEPKERQTVKTPGAIIHEGVGDCKHYSSFINGIIDALYRKGYPVTCMYRFVSDDPGTDVHHVFAVIKDGSGREYWADPVVNTFNKRPIFYNTKNVHMPLKQISGTSAIGNCRIGNDGFVYIALPQHRMGAINDARNYKAQYAKDAGPRNNWTVAQYNDQIAKMAAIRQKEGKGVSHDQAWGAQMFMDDDLSKELAALTKKTGGVQMYPGMIQVDVGPGGHIYSHPVASKTPTTPMPTVANTTVVWELLPALHPGGPWYAWVNKYPPKQGVAKVVDKVVEAGRDVVLKVSLAPARNAFLGLLDLNAFNLATRMYDGWGAHREDMMRVWMNNLGGSGSQLISSINNGLKHSSAPTHRVSNTIGVVSVAAMMALAASIIAALSQFMGKDPGANQQISNAVQQGVTALANTPGITATAMQNPDGSMQMNVQGVSPASGLPMNYDTAMTAPPGQSGNNSLPVNVADDVAQGAATTSENIFTDVENKMKDIWAQYKTQITYAAIGIIAIKYGPALLGKKSKKRR